METTRTRPVGIDRIGAVDAGRVGFNGVEEGGVHKDTQRQCLFPGAPR